MTARRVRASRWLAMLVLAGLLAMHGAAGQHGASGMSMPTGVRAAATMMSPTASHGVDAGLAHHGALAVSSMVGHTSQTCVALPVVLWLLVVATATLVRRRDATAASLSRLGARTARAPPCPPPQARGVCLT